MVNVEKLSIKIEPSSERMLIRPFVPGNSSQVDHILFRIFSIPANEQEKMLKSIYDRINMPDEVVKSIFIKHFEYIKPRIPSSVELSEEMQEFIGAYFSQQYSLESTALFNPSIVLHPVQHKKGCVDFILSLRAIGEGHISSITFREGEIDSAFNITLKKNSPVIYEPAQKINFYNKDSFVKEFDKSDIIPSLLKVVFDLLPERFSLAELKRVINKTRNSNVLINSCELEDSLNKIYSLALSNFTLNFSTNEISERAIYPASPSQSNGLEDARFARFTEDNGNIKYYATFTAYDGKAIMPEILETDNFKKFKISTLNGPAAQNKGMALFPRKINGTYMMLGRQDNESLYIMASKDLYFWYDYRPLVKPTYNWELIQIGNCGSPIEIDEGWLVLTHGVGPVRTYSLGVMLLDKKEPWHVIGRLKEPLLEPTKEERLGYVPNVLYTCGAMAVGRTLVLPYSIGDLATTFALVGIDDIINDIKTNNALCKRNI